MKEKTENKIDFFSELLFDFVQYDLFDPYLNYRYHELVLISNCFVKFGDDIDRNTNMDTSNDLFFWFGPILEEIVEKVIYENSQNSSVEFIKLFPLPYKCLCEKCSCSDPKPIHIVDILRRFCEERSSDKRDDFQIRNDNKNFGLIIDLKMKDWKFIFASVRCPYFYSLLNQLVRIDNSSLQYKIAAVAVQMQDFELIDSLLHFPFTGTSWGNEFPFLRLIECFFHSDILDPSPYIQSKIALKILNHIYKIQSIKKKTDPHIYNILYSIFNDDLDQYIKLVGPGRATEFVQLVMSRDSAKIYEYILVNNSYISLFGGLQLNKKCLEVYNRHQKKKDMEYKKKQEENSDFFSKLVFDFVQYDLFDPYLNYRQAELLMISKTFGDTRLKENKLFKEEDEELLNFICSGLILEEILIKQEKLLEISKPKTFLQSDCLCKECKEYQTNNKTSVGIDLDTIYLKLNFLQWCDLSYEKWKDVLQKVRCPFLGLSYRAAKSAYLNLFDLGFISFDLLFLKQSLSSGYDWFLKKDFEEFIEMNIKKNESFKTFTLDQKISFFNKVYRCYFSSDPETEYDLLLSIFLDDVTKYLQYAKSNDHRISTLVKDWQAEKILNYLHSNN